MRTELTFTHLTLLAPASFVAASFALGVPIALAQDAATTTSGPVAVAEGRPPDECGMTEAAAQYGDIDAGAVVTLQRHRFVQADDNWDDQMGRWVGRPARVTRRSGVDAAGCPGVRVDVDGGQWFWRIRDLGIGTSVQPRPPARAPSAVGVPQECHQEDERARYGPVTVGASVMLGRHRMVDGDDNWADDMGQYVGRRARVVEQAGVDSAGCPGIRVDIDGQSWFWRIRDVRMSDGRGPETGALASSTGVTSDHGRPASVVGWEGAGAGVGGGSGLFGTAAPQECGLADDTVAWGPITIGRSVTLGRHRDVNGDTNWADEMDGWVGQTTTIADLVGVDDQGCPVVHVQIDGGRFFWRIRDMTLP